MKATELIRMLECIISEHGDIPVGLAEPGFGYQAAEKVIVRDAVWGRHWEGRDAESLQPKFIVLE